MDPQTNLPDQAKVAEQAKVADQANPIELAASPQPPALPRRKRGGQLGN